MTQPAELEKYRVAAAELAAKEEAEALKEKEEFDAAQLPDLGDEPVEGVVSPVIEKPVPEVKTEPTPAPDTVSKADYEKLEHRFKVLEGMFKKDNLANEVETLKGRIAALVTENADLKTKTAEPAKPQIVNDTDAATLRERYGDDADLIERRIDKQARAVAAELIKDALGTVDKQIGEVRDGITKTAEQIQAEKLAVYKGRLTNVANGGFADAPEVLNDPAFHAWLDKNDWFEATVNADKSHNVAKVLDKIAKYKASLAPSGDTETAQEKADREALLAEQAAGPGKGRGPKAPAPAEKTLTGLEASKFMAEYLKGNGGIYYKDGKPKPAAKAMYDKLRLAGA